MMGCLKRHVLTEVVEVIEGVRHENQSYTVEHIRAEPDRLGPYIHRYTDAARAGAWPGDGINPSLWHGSGEDT